MAKHAFSHVDTWVFDLDNTLYPPEVGLFDQIEPRMTAWVAAAVGVDLDEANRLRDHYWQTYGTTLAGLMAEHDVDPTPYLVDVHDISFDVLSPDAALAGAISALPGRRVVFTNGTAPYAENVLKARGLSGVFDGIYGVEHAQFRPKPTRAAFDAVFELAEIETGRAAMFEDDPRNLAEPFAMGMRTVHVAPDAQGEDFIDFHTDDLSGFLSQLV